MSDELPNCGCCDGLGGSVGNKDPNDDWICECCGGTGKQAVITLPVEDPPEE